MCSIMCVSVSHSPFLTVIRSLSYKPSLVFQYVTDTVFEGIMDEGILEMFRVVLLLLLGCSTNSNIIFVNETIIRY